MILLNIVCCLIIGAFGFFDFALLLGCRNKFKDILEEFRNIEIVKNQYTETMGSKGDVKISTPSVVEYDRKNLEENRIEFNKQYAKYVVYSQWISLFPLLGIFGTVLGLVLNRDPSNVEQLVSGLSVALWTTLVGLVCSIMLRFIDAIWPGKLVNDIDAKFNTVDGAINRITLERINANNNSKNN